MLNCNKILILSPHPDDEVLSCGGLIAWAKNQKKEVMVEYYSSVLIGVDQCMQIVGKNTHRGVRYKEIEKVSELGQFQYNIVSFENLDFTLNFDLINHTESVIEKFKPDVVCIPSLNSCNQDHRIIFDAAHTALRPLNRKLRHFCKIILEYEEPYGWYQNETFNPNFYLSLTEEEINLKLELISKHKTQLRDAPSTRSLENIKRVAQVRGAETGQTYAEAYKIHRFVV